MRRFEPERNRTAGVFLLCSDGARKVREGAAVADPPLKRAAQLRSLKTVKPPLCVKLNGPTFSTTPSSGGGLAPGRSQ